MSAFSGSSAVTVSGTYTGTGGLSTPKVPVGIDKSITWTTSNCDIYYEETISLAAASVNRDLYGSLTDYFGNTISLATLREIIIVNKSTTDGQDLEVSGNFVTGVLMIDWVDDAVKLNCPAGGLLHFRDPNGFAVTDTTAERITLDPGANTYDVDLILIGKS